MKSEDIILAMWNKWQSWESESLDHYHTKLEQKLIFLSSEILGLTTYDTGLDVEFGSMVLETMKHIQNRTTFEYIEDEENYKKYIMSVNLIVEWLDWGTSIRGAWFNEYNGRIKPDFSLANINHDKDYVDITEGFMEWFISFLEREGE